MRTECIKLDEPIEADCADEVGKRLYFISADIDSFNYVVQGGMIHSLEVTLADGTGVENLAAKINALVTDEIAPLRIMPQKTIWRSSAQPRCGTGVFERLLEEGMVFEAGEGQASLGEPLIWLMDALDARIRDIAVSGLHAKEYRYPTLIPARVLQDCGYFKSFPHMLMFVTRLHNDLDTYQAFAADYQATGGIGPFALAYCKNLDYCLPPTMCYHTYHQLRNRQFEEGENMVIISKGKSFRFESKAHRSLERLWDFTIREIVFLGSRDFVLDCRQRFMAASFALMDELGLAGYCEVASDPFFCGRDTAAKIFAQKALELKYELRLNVEDERTIAAASFNFHDQVFGEGFNIHHSTGKAIRTGCVGFGLERLVYAFVAQHGLNPEHWPPILGEGVGHGRP